MAWNELYRDARWCLIKPADEVVKVVPLLQSLKNRRILDLGYGAGRHVIYLAKLGFEMFGTDISETGEALTREWLVKEKLQAELLMSDMSTVPYPDNFFGGCICRGVITHNRVSGIRACIAEIYRTLAPEGIVMCTFISRESSEFQKGVEIEPSTFVPNEGIEAGVPHHFVDRAEVLALMKAFEMIELYHSKHGSLSNAPTQYVSAHWVFVGKKGSR